MLNVICLLGLFFVHAAVEASEPARTVNYYYGISKIRILLPKQVPLSTEAMLMKRVIDPEKRLLSELTCLRPAGRKAYASAAHLSFGDHQIRVADTRDPEEAKLFKGTVEVSGPEWNWNLLRFSMEWLAKPSHIEDINVVTERQMLARKQIFTPDGQLFETYDVDADRISEEKFQALFVQMECPAIE